MIDLIIMFVSGSMVGGLAVHLLKMIAPPAQCLPSHSRQRKSDQDNRRRRDNTAKMIDHIASLHQSKSLSYPQAVTRICTLEVADETAHRVLDARVKSI